MSKECILINITSAELLKVKTFFTLKTGMLTYKLHLRELTVS